VHKIVEQESGVNGFAAARVNAEVKVQETAYTIDDIYVELSQMLNLEPSAAESLKSLEIQCETTQAIPIQENLLQVRDGDLLVSDMYLHPSQITALLSSAGLDKNVDLRVSSDGKRTGKIWPSILEDRDITEHLGDNRISDYKSPRKFGIPSRLTRSYRMTQTEKAYLSAGLPHLAQLSREVRLGTWHDDKRVRKLQVIQASLNLPLLLTASIQLKNECETAGYKRTIMSSRDCRIWQRLFDRVCSVSGSEVQSEYFYTSRISRTQPSETYRRYAKSRLTEGTVWLDLCGTGWSMWSLLQHIDKPEQPTQLLHPTAYKPDYAGLEQTSSGPSFESSLIPIGTPRVKNSLLEMCNQALDPMTLDVKETSGEFSPIFAADSRSAFTLDAVSEQVDVATMFVERVTPALVSEIESLKPTQIRRLSIELYRILTMEAPTILGVFKKDLVAEDYAVLDSLGSGPGTTQMSWKRFISNILNVCIRGPINRVVSPFRKAASRRAIQRLGN